jgi:hypothetical protein
MMRSFTGLLGMALIAVVGCSNQGTPGGPGATDAKAKSPFYGQANDTFTLSVPHLSSLKQGDAQTAVIGIKRGKNFDEDVTVTFGDLPKGVTLEPASPVIKHGDAEAKITLTAEDEAALGDFKIKVTGHPTKGGDATNELLLTVAKKDAAVKKDTVAAKETFTLSVPALTTTLQQGGAQAIAIGIQRDKNFDQDVTLKFTDVPKGVTFEPARPVIKHGDTETKFTLRGADDTALGNFAIHVTGSPTKGADASREMKLTVTKK